MKKTLKALYDLLPFKKEVFSALKLVWSPKESIYRHLHFKGVFKVSIDKTRNFKVRHYGYQVENEIFWRGLTGGWERESLKLWIKLCESSDVIIDIGANTGIYSLIAKAISPRSKVYAFEPVARVFKKLNDNIGLNSFDIVSIERAVSNYNGMATIFDSTFEHTYSVTVNKNLSDPGVEVVEAKIETVTLDSFVKENSIKNIDLIKIDVETHEPEVLEGFSEYLSKFKPSMLIEVLNNEVGARLHRTVHGLGYLYFNIDEVGTVRQVEKIEKSDYYNYLLCNPDVAAKLGLIKNDS